MIVIKMRKILISVISVILLGLWAAPLLACEVDWEVIGDKKDKYDAGDVLIVKVTVFLTHRNCPEGIKATKFKTDGLKVIQATRWNESSPEVWDRKLKLKVTGNKSKKVKISADRECEKEGGHGVLTLETT